MTKITHILFDCDNTLVLSEELAFEACADLANIILASQGITDKYTGPQLMGEFIGQNFRGMMNGLQKKYNFQLGDQTFNKYVTQEEDMVIAKLEAKAQPCVNCMPVLQEVHDSGKYGMAVVSSSAHRRVLASVTKVDQLKYFPADVIFSAATSLPKPTSKPDPAVYIHAMKAVGKQPSECVAVEDSKSGTGAAVNAGILTIGYVGPYEKEGREKQDEMAKLLTEVGAKVIMYDWKEFWECLEKIEQMPASRL
ncbi:HAD-like domain-containing protein [Pterulicium gracile]|uniref:HAD-like domain-containing protein n=1 Tax=Pterulicium gracile TaxID=1884261 RepID=A0A5C3QR72_9AGAR|nr:HAD-like domain-containing protein [Pterula gracilis]